MQDEGMEERVKQKVSDYIAEYLVQAGIRQGFTVTGGGAMHLNHSFGCQPGLSMLYQHHEQACAIAAESYARVHNELALLCVTTGPGGTNAITGVVGGWLDSIPMLVISGQVRYDTTARSTGLNLRAVGDQEFDICKAVSSMTKYCVMVTEPSEIRYHLEKALYLAKHGRPGPCWLDIPMNVQGATIETENLKGYEPEKERIEPIPEVTEEQIAHVLQKVREAKRPVFYAGNGIRLAGAYDTFLEVIEKLQIPVVTAWDSIDEVWDDHPLYAGRPGIMGDRAGQISRKYCAELGIRHVWARILSVYGPGNVEGSMVMSAIRGFQSGEPVKFTKGEQQWDYLYSTDAARALRLMGESGKDGAVYPLGSGQVRPLAEYIQTIRTCVAPEAELRLGAIPYAPGQVMYLKADITQLTADTGFEPEISFEEGIQRLWKQIQKK